MSLYVYIKFNYINYISDPLDGLYDEFCYIVQLDRGTTFSSLRNQVVGEVHETGDYFFSLQKNCKSQDRVSSEMGSANLITNTTHQPYTSSTFSNNPKLNVALTVKIIKPLRVLLSTTSSAIKLKILNLEDSYKDWSDLKPVCCLNNMDITNSSHFKVSSMKRKGSMFVKISAGCRAAAFVGVVKCRISRNKYKTSYVEERVSSARMNDEDFTYWSKEHYFSQPAQSGDCGIKQVKVRNTGAVDVYKVSWECSRTLSTYTVNVRLLDNDTSITLRHRMDITEDTCSLLTDLLVHDSAYDIWVTGGDNDLIADTTTLYLLHVQDVSLSRVNASTCKIKWGLARALTRATAHLYLVVQDSVIISKANQSGSQLLTSCTLDEYELVFKQCQNIMTDYIDGANRKVEATNIVSSDCLTIWNGTVTLSKSPYNLHIIGISSGCLGLLLLVLAIVLISKCRTKTEDPVIDLNKNNDMQRYDNSIVILHIENQEDN